MFSYNEVTEKLKSSSWPESAKQTLVPVLPRLGKWSLSFVSQQLSSTGSEFIADEISQIIALQPIWYENLQKSQPQEIRPAVRKILSKEQESLNQALLSVILDIRFNRPIAELVPSDLSDQFDVIEIDYLKNLPPSEVANILRSRINLMIKLTDLQSEIKRYCYYRDSFDRDDVEIRTFKTSLENSDELIGTKTKSVSEWIKDFLQFGSSASRTVYNVAYYMTNGPSVRTMGATDRAAISDVLKLYNWLLQPMVNEAEIENYEKHRIIQDPAEIEQPVKPQKMDGLSPLNMAQMNAMELEEEQRVLTPKGVIKDATNIKMAEEKARMHKERTSQDDLIQRKLSALRSRNSK